MVANRQIKFKIVEDLKECEVLWKKLSKNNYLFDDWEYRSCFFDPEIHRPHFILGMENEKIVGLLPLSHNFVDDYYEFLGGDIAERNTLFIEDHSLINLFLENLPQATFLEFIEPDEINNPIFACEDIRFILELEKFDHSFEKYLASFSKKHKKNFLRDLKSLELHNYSIERNNLDHIDTAIKLNLERFGADSFFYCNSFAKGFKKFASIAKARGELEMLSVVINNIPQAIEVAVKHDDIYYVIMGGNNLKIKNIGKLIMVEHIKNAIKLNCKVIDFLADDGGWKKLWNLHEKHFLNYQNFDSKE